MADIGRKAYGVGSAVGNFTQGVALGRQDKRNQELHDLKVEELTQNRDFKNMQREHQNVMRSFMQSQGQDTGPVLNFMQKYDMDDTDPVDAIERNDKGEYLMKTTGGKEVNFKDYDDFGKMVALMGNPNMWAQQMLKKPSLKSVAPGGALVRVGESGRGEEVYRNPKEPGTGMSKYNPQKAYKEIESQLAFRMGAKSDGLGGYYDLPEGNTKTHSMLSAIAQQYERQNPGTRSPGELADIVFSSKDEMPAEDDARRQATREAEEKAGLFRTDTQDFGEGGRSGYIEKQTQDILSKGMQRLQQRVGSQLGSGVGRPSAADQSGQPVQIKNDNDFAQLPSGTRFVGPDGKVRIKP